MPPHAFSAPSETYWNSFVAIVVQSVTMDTMLLLKGAQHVSCEACEFWNFVHHLASLVKGARWMIIVCAPARFRAVFSRWDAQTRNRLNRAGPTAACNIWSWIRIGSAFSLLVSWHMSIHWLSLGIENSSQKVLQLSCCWNSSSLLM